jgi:dihydroxyacid dehydratase/phosphogluconate dehydratase
MMDATTNIKGSAPNRQATDALARAACPVVLAPGGSAPGGSAPGGSINAALHALTSAKEAEEIFKKTSYAPGLKPGGRYVAKDIYEVDVIPLLMKTLLDHGHADGGCIAVAGQTTAENLKSVKPVGATGGAVGPKDNFAPEGAIVKVAGMLQDGDIIGADDEVGTDVKLSDADLREHETKWRYRTTNDMSGALWKYAQRIGPAVDGAVTHPGAAHEKQCYADI